MAETDQIKYTVPSSVQKLFKIFAQDKQKQDSPNEGESKIEIGETISRMAFFYEKIRNAVDYKEEHLLRKNAIHRILKRRFIPGVDTSTVAEPLIKELIQAGYLPNDTLPERKIQEVTAILNKYASLIDKIYHIHERRDRKKIFNWLVGICSCEVEENLGYSETNRASIDFMYNILDERIVLKNKEIKPEIREIQIYIAILKTLMRYDQDMVAYNILRYHFPEWHNLSEDYLDHISLHIYKIKFKVDLQLKHKLADRLNRVVRKYIPVFSILRDVVEENPKEIFTLVGQPDELDVAIKKACGQKYQEIKSKLRRTSFRSIIYIFLTKMLVAIILEVPYELFLLDEKLNYVPIAINVIFHPTLLFLIALLVTVPAEDNTKKIFQGIKDVIYNYKGKEIKHYVLLPQKRSPLFDFIFRLLYFSTYAITFGAIIIVLYLIGFNILGIILFLLFLSLVTYFGLKVRQGARELLIMDDKEGFLTTVINFLAIPIIRAGRWISVNFSKINVFVFFFDIIIEAPFKILIEVFEDWSAYIKEKKEEIYDQE